MKPKAIIFLLHATAADDALFPTRLVRCVMNGALARIGVARREDMARTKGLPPSPIAREERRKAARADGAALAAAGGGAASQRARPARRRTRPIRKRRGRHGRQGEGAGKTDRGAMPASARDARGQGWNPRASKIPRSEPAIFRKTPSMVGSGGPARSACRARAPRSKVKSWTD